MLALFQKKGGSQLRLYELSDVRAIGNGTLETGNEIAPALHVALGAHPDATIVPAKSFGGSAAMALDVDVVGATPGVERIHVYVAMGHHGLVRVKIQAENVAVPATGTPVVEWGPILGASSHYAGLSSWYDNHELWESGSSGAGQEVHPGVDELQREELPMFVDLAVQNDGAGEHYLYVAADFLNWMRFALDDVSDPWGPTMAIDHHEGVLSGVQPLNETQLDLVPVEIDPPNPQKHRRNSFVREIAIVESDEDGPILVVTANNTNFLHAQDQHTEGFHVGTGFGWGGTESAVLGIGKQRTVFYRIDDGFQPQQLDMVNWVDVGGSNLHVPPDQTGNGPLLRVFHNDAAPKGTFLLRQSIDLTCMVEVDVSVDYTGGEPQGPATISVRDICQLNGRKCFRIGSSIVDPDLLLFSLNDGFFPEDGFLVTDFDTGTGEHEIVRWYSPQNACGHDRRGRGGIFWDPSAQWLAEDPYQHYVWAEGRIDPDDDADKTNHWKIMKLDVTSDPAVTSPSELFRWYIDVPVDRFGNDGRRFEQAGSLNLDFDADTGVDMIFATRNTSTQEGIVAMRRDDITTFFETGLGGGPQPSDQAFTLAEIFVTPDNLVTHPEYNDMPDSDPDAVSFWNGTPGTRAALYTWPGKIIRVDSAQQEDLAAWVLAVPCGRILASKDWEWFQDPNHPERLDWAPSGIWETNFGHSLVQFWDVTNAPSIVTDTYVSPNGHSVPGNSPLPKAIGGDFDGMAWDLDSVEANGRVYCFVDDFAGRVLVYDIRDILDQHGQPNAILDDELTWYAPPGLIDDLPSNVLDLVIDETPSGIYVYVGVRRVGIEILSFDPTLPDKEDWLTKVGRLQTANDPFGLAVRVDDEGKKTLLVTDHFGGFRIYED